MFAAFFNSDINFSFHLSGINRFIKASGQPKFVNVNLLSERRILRINRGNLFQDLRPGFVCLSLLNSL